MKAEPYVIRRMKILRSFLAVMKHSMAKTNIVTYAYENFAKFADVSGLKSCPIAPVHSRIASKM